MIDIKDERIARLRIKIKSYGEKLNGSESYDDLLFIFKNSSIIKKEKEKIAKATMDNIEKYERKNKNDRGIKQVIGPKYRIQEPICLISHKSKRIEFSGRCYDCGGIYSTLWRYRESNHGEINLCSICKQNALDRSFLYVDALSMAYNRKIK